jgi:hypothetical protein
MLRVSLMQSVLRRSVLWSAVCLALTACGGNGKGLDENGNPAGSSGGSGELTANFESIQEHIFTPICTACHTGAGAPHGLRLDEGVSYGLLVGVSSDEDPSVKRVAPRNPDGSYLIQKLSGTASVGARMPLGGPYLSQAQIDTIKQWIANGAPQSSDAPPVLAKQVAGLELAFSQPAMNDVVAAPLNQLVLNMNHELDTSLVNNTTVKLERLDMNGSVVAEIPALLQVPDANPSTIVVRPTTPLLIGLYRVSLRGSGGGGGALADLSAQALDHDVAIEFTVNQEATP